MNNTTENVVKPIDILHGTAYAMSLTPDNYILQTMLAELHKSIHYNGWIIPNKIKETFKNAFSKDYLDGVEITSGDMLSYISPLAFIESFDYYGLFTTNLNDICCITINDYKSTLVAIEYIYLLHDIIRRTTRIDDILNILPELDVLESEVHVTDSAESTFFAGLWSFIFSSDYMDAIHRALSLNETSIGVAAVTGALASAYYGSADIPDTWKIEFNEFYKIQGISDNA